MNSLHWIICGLTFVEAGWMTLDGARALLVGDYVTPRAGPYAGQLGPWRHIVKKVGLEPHSTLMKSIFLVYGLAWLGALALLVSGIGGMKWAMIIAAFGTLWFIPIGTTFSVIQLILWFVILKGASS